MSKIKNQKENIHFRVERCDFARLCNIATAERRSLANLCEKIVLDWLSKTETTECTTEDMQR